MLRYFISKEFFLTLFILGVIGVLFYIAIFFWFLPSYTKHGDTMVVPNVFELTHDDAEAELLGLGLNVSVRDCTYVPDLPPGVVVAQYPVALSRVKPKRTIYMTLNRDNPPIVKMPKVEDLSLYHAKTMLESWNLGIGKVIWVPNIADKKVLGASVKGRAVRQGEPLSYGTKVDLRVGKSGHVAKVEIPRLIGNTYEDALAVVRDHGLNIGSVIYNPKGPEELRGRVFSQNPQANFGDSIKAGRTVDIFICGEEPQAQESIEIEEH